MDTYNYNFDAKLDDTMDDQFDAFDNYLLTAGDSDGNNDEDDHNLFMALDSLDFSNDYNVGQQTTASTSSSITNMDNNNNNDNNVVTALDVSSTSAPSNNNRNNAYNNGFNSVMTNNTTKFNMNNNNDDNNNNITINTRSKPANKPSSASPAANNKTNPRFSNTMMTSSSSSLPPPPRRTSGQRGRPGFPIHLHDILAQADHAGFSSIITWLPHGRAFVIHDMTKFASDVLPKYFSHNKISTFQRQLNAYKFKRFAAGPDKGAYYQEFFIRGRPQLCAKMSRIKNKNANSLEITANTSPSCKEPDFYRLPFVGDDGKEQPNPSFKALCPALPTMTFQDNHKKQQQTSSLPLPTKNNNNMPNNNQDDNNNLSISSNWQQILKSYCPSNNNNNTNSKPFPEKNLSHQKEDKDLTTTTLDINNSNHVPLPCHVQEIQIKLKNNSILPKSDHPLDSVTFFIPLDLLL